MERIDKKQLQDFILDKQYSKEFKSDLLTAFVMSKNLPQNKMDVLCDELERELKKWQ